MRLRVPYAADGERPQWVKLRHRRRLSAERRPRNWDIESSDSWQYAGNTLAIETAAVVASSLSY